jgi:uncharacterized protein
MALLRECRMNARAAATDLALVLAAIGIAWGASRLFIYPALSVPDNAPVILRPITGFFVAWALLHWRKRGWDSLGLRMPAVWWRVVAGAVALYLLNLALSEWVVPVLARMLNPQLQPTFLLYIRGSVPGVILWIAIGWIVGGFMEECLFRGFLLTRVAELFGGGHAALAAGIVVQALLFGSMHLYGGSFAFVYATVFALASGIFYLLVGRNLWPLIAVHGVSNSIAVWGVYSS